MSSLVILSQDVQAVSRIEQIAKSLEFRVRHLTEPHNALEWLTMQIFDVFLVDSRYEQDVPINILNLAWKHNPKMTGGVFNPEGIVTHIWDARVIGAHVFSEEAGFEEIEQMLSSVPKPFVFDENQRRAVLFVEDLDAPRDIICAYLESLGYPNVKGVSGVGAAIKMLLQAPDDFFCVITDIRMPRITGIQLIKGVRSHPRLRHLPVLVLTSVPTSGNLLECLKAGVTGFLTKPPRKAAMRQELEKAKRVFLTKQSPRLCQPDDAGHVEEALRRTGRVDAVEVDHD